MSYRILSPVELDALKEVGNIGLGNAVTSLAQLINRRVSMHVPRTCFLPYEEMINMIGGYEELVGCVSLRVLGDAPGMVLYVFNEESTYRLVDMLIGAPVGTTAALDEMAESAIKEVGNVLTGSFISAIGMMTGLNMITTVPLFAFDMLGAVLTSLMVAAGRVEDQVLVIETELFHDLEVQIKGHFFLLTEPGAIDRLISALGVSGGGSENT
ncbi:CheY-P-specific phosphatase CheC [Desulfofundulus thermobenzoicus]|uniref:CheY-P-specific phosphatase CheC n=1 Tax=Desulfofundulus thermobenzoicus TaxID=29376 RepID=A0A6N7IP88_9FIRM|nr:CheY-P-specific phosphatase CheC [Desulfofundulus thermobenzoicus]HHW43745.1 chemotaxis protein CheC [Desulfotomaculum sp.]